MTKEDDQWRPRIRMDLSGGGVQEEDLAIPMACGESHRVPGMATSALRDLGLNDLEVHAGCGRLLR